MKNVMITLVFLGVLAGCSDFEPVTAPEAAFSHNENADFKDEAPVRTFEVTVENLVEEGQYFTPPLVAIHRGAHKIFEEGRPASFGIQQIAENGNLGPMMTTLGESRHVSSFDAAGGPVPSLGSATVSVTGEPGSQFVSVVSMLICTNDGFTGVSGAKLPNRVGEEVHLYAGAYDAGTEINTQDFGDLVPPCQAITGIPQEDRVPGSGTSDPALAENGVVRHHEGILMDVGDLTPDFHGWSNPAARITVKRTG